MNSSAPGVLTEATEINDKGKGVVLPIENDVSEESESESPSKGLSSAPSLPSLPSVNPRSPFVRMNPRVFCLTLVLLAAVAGLLSQPLRAQATWLTPFNQRDTQRNAAKQVRSTVGWVRNATQSAGNLSGGVDVLGQRYNDICRAYDDFKSALNPDQLNYAGNQLAELDAGLGIIGEAFNVFQDDLAAGRSDVVAFRDLSRALREASAVWLQQFDRTCSSLRIPKM